MARRGDTSPANRNKFSSSEHGVLGTRTEPGTKSTYQNLVAVAQKSVQPFDVSTIEVEIAGDAIGESVLSILG